jgi:hypothetical protein
LFKIDFEKVYDKVRWSCPGGLGAKRISLGLDQKDYVHYKEGVVCININGKRTSCFNTYQGLRQGYPLSPLLFNLVAKALVRQMRKTTGRGRSKGS